MKRRIWFGINLLMIFAAHTTNGQQPTAPQNPAAAPDLASTIKAIEDTLRSSGRLTWTQNLGHYKNDGNNTYRLVVDRQTLWEQTANVAADPTSCLLKVSQRTNRYKLLADAAAGEDTLTASYYFDEMFSVDVLSSEDYLHRYLHESTPTSYQEDVQPRRYSVAVAVWGYTRDFKFPLKEYAQEFVALLREAVKQCRTGPVQQATNGPGLAETLIFIAQKLRTQGQVDASWTEQSVTDAGVGIKNSIGSSSTKFSVDYLQVTPNPATCSLDFDENQARLSLRHISKIEVLSLKDFRAGTTVWDSGLAVWEKGQPVVSLGQGILVGSKTLVTDASPVFVLKVTSPGVASKQLYFSDETLANRVAKAMVHAAELCGAGTNREPF
jgi:hypothetical protein